MSNLNLDRPSLLIRGLRGVASETGLSERTVWALVASNALPHKRVGRALIFARAELQAWIDAGCPTKPGSAKAFQKKGGQK